MRNQGRGISPHALGLRRVSGPIHRNAAPSTLIQLAMETDGCSVASTGALLAYSGAKTGRSPDDKRVVVHPESEGNIWWGSHSPNKPLSAESYEKNRSIALSFLEQSPTLFVQDGLVNWGNEARLKVRVVCSRAYHALFMRNLMIRLSDEELQDYGEPDFCIYNAGKFPADQSVPGVDSETSVAINIERGEMLILGTEYAGEMKKGIFSVMHYMMPCRDILTLHSGCNVGKDDDTTLFFGLSGTGKTTLSSDPSGSRQLIGDDEHCWAAGGIFNIEGGCYAKCINLSQEKEPEIFQAIRHGTVLENVKANSVNGMVDYDDTSLTENTRAAYPIEYISNARIPCVGPHPSNIVLLCCDAFGVLPPVARLTRAQMMYHFCSGYTAKVAGTEMGVREPSATFSACFGGAFLMWHPMKYAAMLAEKTDKHSSTAWFVNTGWTGGSYGVGKRMDLKYTRSIIDAIHCGELDDTEYITIPTFGFSVPKHVPGVPDIILQPRLTWQDPAAYDAQLLQLGQMFVNNMALYEKCPSVKQELVDEILQGGPHLMDNGSDPGDVEDTAPIIPRISSCGIANGSVVDSMTVKSKLFT